LFPFL